MSNDKPKTTFLDLPPEYKAMKLLEKIGFTDMKITKSDDGDDLFFEGMKYSDRANAWVRFTEKVVLFHNYEVKDLVYRFVREWLNEEKTLASKAMLDKIKQW